MNLNMALLAGGVFIGGGAFVLLFGVKWIIYMAIMLFVCEIYKQVTTPE